MDALPIYPVDDIPKEREHTKNADRLFFYFFSIATGYWVFIFFSYNIIFIKIINKIWKIILLLKFFHNLWKPN